MASNNLDQQPGEKLVTDIKLIKNQLSELRTLQLQGTAAVNMTAQNYTNYTTTVNANSTNWLWLRFVNTHGVPVFGTLEFTFYQGGIDPANAIDSSTSTTIYQNWDIKWWQDYAGSVGNGDLVYGPFTCLEYHFELTNKTGSNLAIWMTGRQRIVASSGSTT